jgi:hypothetical protein
MQKQNLDIETDYILTSLVRVAELDVEVGITLYINGLTITGHLINAVKYFELLSEEAKDGFGDGMSKGFDQHRAAIEKIYKSNKNYRTDVVRFIHLRDARIVSGSHFTPTIGKGILWRGKTNKVDAFHLGIIMPSIS